MKWWTLMKWWAKRDALEATNFKSKIYLDERKIVELFFSEMEREFSNWITTKRAASCCKSAFFK